MSLYLFLDLYFALKQLGQRTQYVISLRLDVLNVLSLHSVQQLTADLLVALRDNKVDEWLVRYSLLVALVNHVHQESTFFQFDFASQGSWLQPCF